MLVNTLIRLLIILVFLTEMQLSLMAKVKILYPLEDRKIYFYKKIHIIGLLDRKEKVSIKVNSKYCEIPKEEGKKFKTKDRNYYLFTKFVNLKEGLNYINISTENYEKSFYVEYVNEPYKIRFRKISYFHMNENVKVCQRCHILEDKNQCKICHIKFSTAKYIHGPVVTWQCFTCHDKNNYFSVIEPVYVRCLKCHQEFSDNMFNAKYAHAPSVSGNCIICHTPHISNQKFFISDYVDKICVSCHEYKALKRHFGKRKVSHKKVSCVKCHNPHYGESKFLFVKNIKTVKRLCKECHK